MFAADPEATLFTPAVEAEYFRGRRNKAMQSLAAKLGPRAVLALSALMTLVVTAAPYLRFH